MAGEKTLLARLHQNDKHNSLTPNGDKLQGDFWRITMYVLYVLYYIICMFTAIPRNIICFLCFFPACLCQ